MSDPVKTEDDKPEVVDSAAKTKAVTRAKNADREYPVSTRSGGAKPVFEANVDDLAAQSNGNTADISKPAPTPTRSTAVNMLLVSWSEMKMKFADFDHKLDKDDSEESELQEVIDFLHKRI